MLKLAAEIVSIAEKISDQFGPIGIGAGKPFCFRKGKYRAVLLR